VKNEYNKQYSSYVRSDCYEQNNNYYYNICPKGDDCSIDNNVSNNTTQGNAKTNQEVDDKYYIKDVNVPNKEKLDNLLTKLEGVKDTIYKQNIQGYLNLLDGIIKKLDVLNTKYKSNDKVVNIINYLKG